eukprot:TRINITY_DN10405_c0_g1_i2.p2 TRINITY_DN10405_c0_g1~~TRINITY_DN10405_c0_g1_i2.p2  ORF type:complete len:136 (+),score=20.14 TRINITY_DN10405_c0_g1_i2:500-907(+)
MAVAHLHLKGKDRQRNETGLCKEAQQRVRVVAEGVEGDYNSHRATKHNNRLDWAVSIFPMETLAELRAEGWGVAPGHLGENITTDGVPYDQFEIGQRYRIGTTLLEISGAMTPCYKLKTLPYVGAELGARLLAQD